ncbi:hypothetical protein [Sphingomonas sp. ACRSK]|uniref:hypothetical protein n=1 Tax=Sphingomonas sp. ACRSK TaxID=2918213 RepID=UPI001EF46355|nr:hypothetical protein [Sphingomonas sp. ACRSK]MCG7346926.1 hypothetical protein [Sphingomonas sp. ACRSK]
MLKLLIGAALALGQVEVPPPAVDPLTAEIETGDADRFAALLARTEGPLTAEQIQRDYLDGASEGVRVFTPGRIRDAAHLARTVAAKRGLYTEAVRECLPVVKGTTPELRATYLALSGLFPGRPLPRIYLVVGADNSGGTAAPGMQVLGLETLCRIAGSPEALRAVLRQFYAHETVHALQRDGGEPSPGGPLLRAVLAEGAADFIAALATGTEMDPKRAAWGSAREAALWQMLKADLATTADTKGDPARGSPAEVAMHRWVGNYSSAPEGWPGEAGYWMGQRIWERWYARQPDKRRALEEMLTISDPLAVLDGGRFVE